MTNNLYLLSKQLGELCLSHGVKIALAESCTGGSVSALITDVPGSSAWFNGAALVYSNVAKNTLLNVDLALLKEHGAVSEPVAKAMAQGMLEKLPSDLALSITGVAGPSGGTKEKPVGMVCFGLADKTGFVAAKTMQFASGRGWIRQSATEFALQWMMDRVGGGDRRSEIGDRGSVSVGGVISEN